MGRRAYDGWPEGQVVDVPHSRRSNDHILDMHNEAQQRITAGLRSLYSDVLLQPLPHRLSKLVHDLGACLEAARREH